MCSFWTTKRVFGFACNRKFVVEVNVALVRVISWLPVLDWSFFDGLDMEISSFRFVEM